MLFGKLAHYLAVLFAKGTLHISAPVPAIERPLTTKVCVSARIYMCD